MGIFPKDDTFQEFSTAYGERLTSYIRHQPWLTAGDSQSGFAIDVRSGNFHDGYSGKSPLAVFHAMTGSGGATPGLCSVIWRQAYLTNVRTGIVFQAIPVGGSPTWQQFRYVGVSARVSGGTYDETDPTHGQFVKDTTGYWALLAYDGSLARWLILRVNAGVITLLSSKQALQQVQATTSGAHSMTLDVVTNGSQVDLTIMYDGQEIDVAHDTSGSRITAAGRCGFGMCRDRRDAGATGDDIIHAASRFLIHDLSTSTVLLYDDFRRVNAACNPATADNIGTSGQVLMSMWTLDIHGPEGWTTGSTQYRDIGNNRVQAQGGTYNFSQIPASDPYTQARSVTFFKDSIETELVATGVILRAAFNSSGGVSNGYLFTIFFVNTTYTAILRRYNAGVSTTLATANVSTGYGLSITDEYEVSASVRSNGATPESGVPLLEFDINGLRVIGWTPLVAGVTVEANRVLDGTGAALLQGTAQGIHLTPPNPGGGSIFYRLWTEDVEDDVPTAVEENEPSIHVPSEATGKSGTLSVPIGSRFSVEYSHQTVKHPFETDHAQRLRFGDQLRRRWKVGLPEAMTDDERDDLWDFWNDHGIAVPFDFADPEDGGSTICGHLVDDKLSTIKQAPGVYGYEFTIEELFEYDTVNTIAVGRRELVITPQRPQLRPISPPRANLTLILKRPLLTNVLPMPNAALTITEQVPVLV